MLEITKDNLTKVIEYYHNFHDSYIISINYNVKNVEIELFIDMYWSGESIKKTYEINPTIVKMVFEGIEQVNINEMFS